MMKGTDRRVLLLVVLLLVIPPAHSATVHAASPASGAPVATITLPANNTLLAPGDMVRFDGRRSFDPEGQITGYAWDLGDGNVSAGAEGNHTYSSTGNYTVTLTVSTAAGGNASASVGLFVKLPSGLPVTIGIVTPSSGKYTEGNGITFGPQGILTGPLENDTNVYIWDFGDGKTFTGRQPRHTYDRPGTYNVTLTFIQGDTGLRETLQVRVYPVTSPNNDLLFIGIAVSIVLVVGIAAFLGGTELGLLLLSPLFVFLYSRIRQDQILDNYTRGQIHGYILANPGEHYNSIKTALGLNNGTLAYHLKRLENEMVIKSAMDGSHRRYYPANMKVPETGGSSLTEVQKLVLSKISETPGISQRDIAVLMGLSNATVNYHIERLLAKGMVRRERAGMRYKCYLGEAVPGESPAKEN